MAVRVVRHLVVAFIAGFAAFGAPASLRAQDGVQVLLSTGQALHEVFPKATTVEEYDWRPSAAQRAAVETRLGRALEEPAYRFLLAYDSGRRFLGYALVTDERGKYRPITFLVGITPDFRVQDAAVMVYRESRGGEVSRKRFLSQYRGKGLGDPLQVNRDIVNVSGATISVRSVTGGVKKVLLLASEAFEAGRPPLTTAALRPVASLR